MTVTILTGDARERLKGLPDRSFNTCVSSPPYYGLRDYGTATWEGGEEACQHAPSRGLQGSSGQRQDRRHTQGIPHRLICAHCGARRIDQQIGLELTPDEYVQQIVMVFSEVRRVLRDDGTLWLNLGDSYAGSWGAQSRENAGKHALNVSAMSANQVRAAQRSAGTGSLSRTPFLKPKDLMGIPWRVAFALQADGWYLRKDIIWHKPNPMPESVRDRPTTSHEYLFLLSKSGSPTIWQAQDTLEWSSVPDLSQRLPAPTEEDPEGTEARWRGFDYYYDADAISEPTSADTHARAARGRSSDHKWADGGPGNQTIAKGAPSAGRRPGVSPKSAREGSGVRANESWHASTTGLVERRNKRSVWTVPTQPFPEAHFATYPPALIAPCILAGSPKGGTVLDPFGGAGTTGLVADSLGRNCTLIELNPDYAAMADRRLRAGLCRVDGPPAPVQAGPLFDVEAA